MGIGNILSESLKQSGKSGGGEGGSGGGGGGGNGDDVPDVMTPSEAASYLKVSEEDVVAAIEAGDLKAKKLGKAYRISKESLDKFLNS
jgi:excisionase family DNA binding protein